MIKGEIIFHEANDEIVYNWFSYVPETITKEDPVYILVHPGNTGFDYDLATCWTKSSFEFRTQWADDNNFILLAPVIPRDLSDYDVYTISYEDKVFDDSMDYFYQRPGIKLNKMIDKLMNNLRLEGYSIYPKVFMEGFSASAMFTQRYALIYPERVQAIAAGNPGGSLVLPISIYNDTTLDWPIGINGFKSFVGYDFNFDLYKQIPQFIYLEI